MFLIYGKRKVKIKEFTDQSHRCTDCKNFDLRVKVFREYYHAFYIPFVAFGDKTSDIRCNQCGEPIRTEALKKEHEENTRTPFYLYSLTILLAGLVAFLVSVALITQVQTRSYIANPKVGDVYSLHDTKDALSAYRFLQVAKVKDDTVMVYQNNVRYMLNAPDKLSDDDYFVTADSIYFTKAELKQMLEKDEILVAKRK